jgi:hypothetical protein
MTNYERIKAMSVEEIEGLLHGGCNYCIYCGENCANNPEMHCTDGIIQWLHSEVKE